MNSLNVKKGDHVIVLTGKDKGKKGTVISASPKNETVVVEGVNIITKHVKPRNAQTPGGIQKEPGNIHVSNVQIVCPDCGKPTRVGYVIADGKKTRVCKHCGASLDKAGKAKKEKKPARKAKSEDGETTAPVKKTARKSKAEAADKE